MILKSSLYLVLISNLLNIPILQKKQQTQKNKIKKRTLYFLTLATFYLPLGSLVAFEPLKIEKSVTEYNYASYIYFLEDPAKDFQAEDVAKKNTLNFTRNPKNDINFGYTNGAYWLRLDIESNYPHTRILDVGSSFVDSIRIYKISSKSVDLLYLLGAKFPYSHRPLASVTNNIPIDLEKGKTKLLLRMSSRYSINNPLPFLRTEKSFFATEHQNLLIYAIFFGFVLSMLLFTILQYLNTDRDKSSLYYMIYLIGFWFSYFSVFGLGYVYLWPNYPKIQYISLPFFFSIMGVGLSIFSMRFLQLNQFLPWAHKTVLGILLWFFAAIPLSLFWKAHWIHLFNMPIMISLFLILVFAAVSVYQKGYHPARFYLLAFSIFLFSGILVMATSLLQLPVTQMFGFYTVMIGNAAQVLLINLAIFDKHNFERKTLTEKIKEVNQKLEIVNKELQLNNEAYFRFVPKQFLNSLNRHSIREIQLGDQVEKYMTVLFSDIRSFTNYSEKLNSAKTFEFINQYLGKMSPIIEANDGFIDKFIGDAIMALFPNQPSNAIDAAVQMQQKLYRFNQIRTKNEKEHIKIGIGMHSGNLMLGTVGSMTRMDGTVISDTVNVASRLENLTALFGAQILISDQILGKIDYTKNYSIRLLGHIKVKGKEEPMPVFEILDGYPEDRKKLFLDSLYDFEKAVQRLFFGEIDAAEPLFKKILEHNPYDRPSMLLLNHLNRCKKHNLDPHNLDPYSIIYKSAV